KVLWILACLAARAAKRVGLLASTRRMSHDSAIRLGRFCGQEAQGSIRLLKTTMAGTRPAMSSARMEGVRTMSALKCFSAAALLLGRPRGGGSDDPVEFGLWADRTMDGGMSHDIELQPLDVVVEHDRVVGDVGRRR